MARHTNPIIGDMACPACGYRVAIAETSTGKFSLGCDGCQVTAFAPPGSPCHETWSSKMTRRPARGAAPAAAPAAPAAPAPKPTPVAAGSGRGGFDLGNI